MDIDKLEPFSGYNYANKYLYTRNRTTFYKWLLGYCHYVFIPSPLCCNCLSIVCEMSFVIFY